MDMQSFQVYQSKLAAKRNNNLLLNQENVLESKCIYQPMPEYSPSKSILFLFFRKISAVVHENTFACDFGKVIFYVFDKIK